MPARNRKSRPLVHNERHGMFVLQAAQDMQAEINRRKPPLILERPWPGTERWRRHIASAAPRRAPPAAGERAGLDRMLGR